MATNGDDIDIVEPDWREMERHRIDALGPKFEALVDTLMREIGSAPEKREEVRSDLYHDLYVFGHRSMLYNAMDNVKPRRKWLKRVHDAARTLKKLLDDRLDDRLDEAPLDIDPPGPRFPGGSLNRLSGDLSGLVAVTKDTSDMHLSVGRRSHDALHQFVGDLADTYKLYTGKKIGRSHRRRRGVNKGPEAPSGPFFRLVEAALSVAGVQMSAEAIQSLIRRVIEKRRG